MLRGASETPFDFAVATSRWTQILGRLRAGTGCELAIEHLDDSVGWAADQGTCARGQSHYRTSGQLPPAGAPEQQPKMKGAVVASEILDSHRILAVFDSDSDQFCERAALLVGPFGVWSISLPSNPYFLLQNSSMIIEPQL